MRSTLVLASLLLASITWACPTGEAAELRMARLELRALQRFPWEFRRPPGVPFQWLEGAIARIEGLERGKPLGGALNDTELKALVARLRAGGLSDAQLHLLAGSPGYLCAAQARELLSVFTYEDDRIRALQILAWRILDGENAALLDPLFSTAERRNQARAIVAPR